MSERDVLDLLAARYTPPEWAFLRHVANGTGRNQSRTADGLAMNLWPSRGLELHGFEVKSYRSDWLREAKDPAKADEIATRCHRWWIVAADAGVVSQDDLFPQTWGLMVVREDTLVVVREAPPLVPVPLSWEFLAGILRRASEAQTRQRPTEGAIIRARGVDPVTSEDAAKLRARMGRLQTTADRIGRDVQRAIYDLDRAERLAREQDTEAA